MAKSRKSTGKSKGQKAPPRKKSTSRPRAAKTKGFEQPAQSKAGGLVGTVTGFVSPKALMSQAKGLAGTARGALYVVSDRKRLHAALHDETLEPQIHIGTIIGLTFVVAIVFAIASLFVKF